MKDLLTITAAAGALLAVWRWSRRPEVADEVEIRSLATSVALQRMARYDRERWERMLRYFAAWETGWRTTPARRHVEQIRKANVA